MMAGEVNGEVWEWHTTRGWKKVPGSEMARPNGIVMSKDGKWLYINGWGSQTFERLSRGASEPKKDVIKLDFRPDNVRWAPDGNLFVGGQTTDNTGTRVVRIDAKTLKVTPLITWKDIPGFGGGTGAIQVGNDLCVSAFKADRIGVFPLPKK
jgi:sugar lactone lactonase YvrE